MVGDAGGMNMKAIKIKVTPELLSQFMRFPDGITIHDVKMKNGREIEFILKHDEFNEIDESGHVPEYDMYYKTLKSSSGMNEDKDCMLQDMNTVCFGESINEIFRSHNGG